MYNYMHTYAGALVVSLFGLVAMIALWAAERYVRAERLKASEGGYLDYKPSRSVNVVRVTCCLVFVVCGLLDCFVLDPFLGQ